MKKKLYIWRLEQNENRGWDTYDSMVVISESEKKAKQIHPRNYKYDENYEMWYSINYKEEKSYLDSVHNSWSSNVNKVKAIKVGIADESLSEGYIICASFNAG